LIGISAALRACSHATGPLVAHSCLQDTLRLKLKTGYDRFLLHPSEVITHRIFESIYATEKASLRRLRNCSQKKQDVLITSQCDTATTLLTAGDPSLPPSLLCVCSQAEELSKGNITKVKPTGGNALPLNISYSITITRMENSNYQYWPRYENPCHHCMVRPGVADGGDGLQIWRVAANRPNKQPRTAGNGWFSSLGVGRRANISSP